MMLLLNVVDTFIFEVICIVNSTIYYGTDRCPTLCTMEKYTPFFLGILLRQVQVSKYKKDTYFVITVPVYVMWPVRRKIDFIQVLKRSM